MNGATPRITDIHETALEESQKVSRDMADFKEGEEKLSRLVNPTVKDPATGHEMPARVIYAGKKLKMSRHLWWYVQALQSLSITELRDFVKHYRNELTIAETEVVELLFKVAAGDKEAKERLWQVNKDMFNAMRSVYLEDLKLQRSELKKEANNLLSDTLQKIGQQIIDAEKSQEFDK